MKKTGRPKAAYGSTKVVRVPMGCVKAVMAIIEAYKKRFLK